MIYTYRNLAHLRLSRGRARAGVRRRRRPFELTWRTRRQRPLRVGLTCDRRNPNSLRAMRGRAGRAADVGEHADMSPRRVATTLPAAPRSLPRPRLRHRPASRSGCFTPGLLDSDADGIVYPRPEPAAPPLPPRPRRGRGTARGRRAGRFRRRATVPARAIRRGTLHGRLAARVSGLLGTKQFDGPRRCRAGARLRPAAVPLRPRGEAVAPGALGARCPLRGRAFGLRLPGTTVRIATGRISGKTAWQRSRSLRSGDACGRQRISALAPVRSRPRLASRHGCHGHRSMSAAARPRCAGAAARRAASWRRTHAHPCRGSIGRVALVGSGVCVWSYAQRPLPGRWLLVAVVWAPWPPASVFHYRTLLGRDAGVASCWCCSALKLLETRARRDVLSSSSWLLPGADQFPVCPGTAGALDDARVLLLLLARLSACT